MTKFDKLKSQIATESQGVLKNGIIGVSSPDFERMFGEDTENKIRESIRSINKQSKKSKLELEKLGITQYKAKWSSQDE